MLVHLNSHNTENMNVRLRATLNSLNIAKFNQIQKNLSKPPPNLWPDGELSYGVHTLRRSHPIFLTLDRINPTLQLFNQVHAHLIVSGNFQHPMASGRLVKKLCSSKLTLPHAINLFSHLEDPDAFVCNTIMRGYVNFDEPEKALAFYYHQMVEKGIEKNNYTFPALVKACADMGVVRVGEKVHGNVIKCGFELNLYVRNTLIHMYAVFGRIGDARKVFDLSPESDLVTWNTMIDGYVKNGEVQFARRVFDSMPESDVFSWNTMISAYAGIGDMETAKELFEKMPSRDIVSWNCMIDGYSQIGDVISARTLFDQMGCRNVVSWNSMMALYVRMKDCNECLRLFERMMQEGDVKPNEATLMSVLTACAHLGRLDKGEWVHSYIKYSGRIKPDVLLSTAVLTMYAKCGAVDLAKHVFDEMPEKNVVSWNSMIMGYGIHGKGERALEIFLEMEGSGVMPNDATFVCVLSACTHSGMILEGWWFFWLMQRVYRIEPKVEHYGCMVDLLGRAGLMNDSEELIRKMPMESGPALWGALLSACRTHSDMELGEIIAMKLIKLKPDDIGPYVLLSNIYSSAGRWDDVENVRKMIAERGVRKAAGSSLLQKILESFPSESSFVSTITSC